MHQLLVDRLRRLTMLTRLIPEQVSKFWDIIKFAVEESLPPIVGDHPDKMNRILSAALSSKIEVWVSYVKGEEANKFEGVVLTKTLYDNASDTKNLLIYCIYGYEEVGDSSWFGGIDKLAMYAKSRGCSQIIAYTDSPYIVKIVKRLGGEADYTFCSFDVNKIVQKINGLGEV